MLKIFTNNPEAADPVIPIKWCLSPEAREILKQEKAVHPHLLLSIVYQGKEVERKLIPLDQAMEYVEFRRPGAHRVLGTIVWPNSDDVSKMKKYYLQENSQYRYENRILEYDTAQFLFWAFHSSYLREATELAVVIADGFFPKEPPAWEKRWVNLWFETKPKDPCQTRKRRFLAYSIQPIAVLLWIVISVALRFLTALGSVLLLGMRGVDFGAILHPFRDEFRDVYYDAKSVFIWDKDGKERPEAHMVFTPIFPLLIFGALFLVPLTIIWKVFGTVIMVGGAFVLIYIFFDRVRSEKSRMSQQEKEQKAAEEELDKTLQLVACENTTPYATLGSLPKSRQTLYLRFNGLKAKVCRPYAIK